MSVIEIGLLSAGLTLFINYCIGKPASEFSPYEIFSGYTIWLSIRRLKKIGLYNQYIKQYNQNLNRAEEKHEIISLKNDFKKILYDAAEPFFTWERAAGMCPVCSGVWTSIAFGLVFTKNLVYLLIIVLISHIVIRLANKLL